MRDLSKHMRSLIGLIFLDTLALSSLCLYLKNELIQKSGSYEVAIIEGDTGRKILVGEFQVRK